MAKSKKHQFSDRIGFVILALLFVAFLWFMLKIFIISTEEAQAATQNLCQSQGMWDRKTWDKQYVGIGLWECVDHNGELHVFRPRGAV